MGFQSIIIIIMLLCLVRGGVSPSYIAFRHYHLSQIFLFFYFFYFLFFCCFVWYLSWILICVYCVCLLCDTVCVRYFIVVFVLFVKIVLILSFIYLFFRFMEHFCLSMDNLWMIFLDFSFYAWKSFVQRVSLCYNIAVENK